MVPAFEVLAVAPYMCEETHCRHSVSVSLVQVAIADSDCSYSGCIWGSTFRFDLV